MLTLTLLLALGLSAPASSEGLEEAKGFLAKGWFDDAARAFQALYDEAAANETAGDEDELALLLAEARIGNGEVEAALALLAQEPESFRVKLLTGHAYRAWADNMAYDGASTDDVEFTRLDAMSHYTRAVEIAPPGDSSAVVALGNLQLFGLNRYLDAIALAESHLAKRPSDPELLLLRGNALAFDWFYKSQGSDQAAADDAWEQAVDDLEAADAQLPEERFEALTQLVYLYRARGRAVDAVSTAVEIAERQDDPDLSGLYEMAKTYAYARQFAAAGAALDAMVKMNSSDLRRRIRRESDPDDVALNLHWAVSIFNDRDNATAQSILAAITATDPQVPVIWDNFAVACEATGRIDEALAAYDKKIELQPEDPRTYNDKAKLLEVNQQRPPTETIPLYEKCIAMAKEQLQAEEIDPAWKAHLDNTLSVAQSNLDALRPAPSLLDSVLGRLRNAGADGGGADGVLPAEPPPESPTNDG